MTMWRELHLRKIFKILRCARRESQNILRTIIFVRFFLNVYKVDMNTKFSSELELRQKILMKTVDVNPAPDLTNEQLT